MFTIQKLEEKGAQVVAGLVIFKGRKVEGVWASGEFHPADGELLAAEDVEVREVAEEAPAKPAKKATK